jgi:hypothetical protein
MFYKHSMTSVYMILHLMDSDTRCALEIMKSPFGGRYEPFTQDQKNGADEWPFFEWRHALTARRPQNIGI